MIPLHYLSYLTLYIAVISTANDHELNPQPSKITSSVPSKNNLASHPNSVLFNHLYIVLDSTTFTALRENVFLKDTYAALDAGMPDFNQIQENSSAIYLRGENHYLEILGPKNSFEEPVGQIGIGFSIAEHKNFPVDIKDFIADSTAYLNGSSMAQYTIHEEQINWYKAFYSKVAHTNLYTWYAQYNPNFLNLISRSENEKYTRKNFLKKAYAKDKLFKDVSSIVLNCTTNDYDRIVQELTLLDCPLMERNTEFSVYRVNEITLKLKRTLLKASQVEQITAQLNRPDQTEITLGNMSIRNTGEMSTWVLSN